MRIDDRLSKQNKELEKKKQKRIRGEEDEETLTYEPWKMKPPINAYKGEFGDNSGDGINTALSVFDKTAIFHTGEG